MYLMVLMLSMIGNVEVVEGEAITNPCPDSKGCHVVPYLFAETSGGFLGEARSRSNPPRFTLSCGGNGVTGIIKTLEPDARGLVIQEFGPLDEHMYCGGEAVEYNRISGLKDGGWFWITRGSRVAVAPLLARSVLRNRKVRFVDPGFGVTLDRKRYSTLIEEKSTGRLVMMLNVMPEPEPPPPEKCGPIVVQVGEAYEYQQLLSECLVGDGGTYIQFSTYGPGGSLVPITEGVVRRPFSGEYAIDLSLWLNESGSINSGFDPTVGWNSIEGARPLDVSNWSVVPSSSFGPGATLENAGIDISNLDDGYFVVQSSDDYCSGTSRHSLTITARAFVSPDDNPISPPPRKSKSDQSAASSNLTVECPRLAQQKQSSNDGVELVPHAGLDNR